MVRILPLLALLAHVPGAPAQDKGADCAAPSLAAYSADARPEEQRQQHWRKAADAYIGCLFAKNRAADAYLTVEFFKGRLLADRMSLDAAERGLTEDERATLRRMRRTLASLERDAAHKTSLGEAAAREASQADELRRRIAEYRSLSPAEQLPSARSLPDWYRSIAAQDKDGARLSYFFQGNSVYGFVETGGNVLAQRLGDRDAVREALDAYRLLMRELAPPRPADATRAKSLLRFLSDVLLKPFAEQLKGRARVLVSPDQFLVHAPFDALHVNDLRLGDQAEVAVLPSFALHARLAQRGSTYARSPREAFFGVSSARAGEVRAIADLLRPRGGVLTLTDADASEARLNRLADEGRLAAFRAVHFAARGFVLDEEPALGAIVLAQPDRAPGADGYLTGAELASLELRADLVVISGCDFGPRKLQRGEGLLGMSWSLFQSGAQGGLLTLWPVRETDAARLMLRFYEEWGEGVSTAAALARAKRWALQAGVARQTVDAFTLFGG